MAEKVGLAQSTLNRVFFLDFGDDGKLANYSVLAQAIDEIKASYEGGNQPIRKILILSYGWNHTRDGSRLSYLEQVRDYFRNADPPAKDTPDIGAAMRKVKLKDFIVFCVSWDSGDGAVGTAVEDLVPAPIIGNAIAVIPKYALFPFTFWSKARLADVIGYNDMVEAMTIVIDKGFTSDRLPTIYLVGHSFGCRVLSGLCKDRLGSESLASGADRRGTRTTEASTLEGSKRDQAAPEAGLPFKYQDRIGGAVFFQPAASRFNLPEVEAGETNGGRGYPCIVTQSRHDHANGMLFPVGNLILNSYSFTFATAKIDRILPRPENVASEAFRETSIFAASLVWTAFAIPTNYFNTQVNLIAHRRFDYLMDSLAQLPVVEVPVAALDPGPSESTQTQPSDLRWGSRTKGIFELGAPFESAGRMVSPELEEWSTEPVALRHDEALERIRANRKGCWYVDDFDHIDSDGSIDYNNRVSDFTIGWPDVVGAHNGFAPSFDYVKEMLLLPEKPQGPL